MKFANLLAKLDEAYGTSTRNHNRFEEAVNSIAWDYRFYADGEHYFVKDGHTLTTPSLDPFDMPWKPSLTPCDWSGVVELGGY